MRHMKKIFIGILVMLMSLTTTLALVACGPNQSSPEAIAKAFVEATAKMDFIATMELSSYAKDFTSEQKQALKSLGDIGAALMSAEEKAELQSTKFVKYEKVSGDETTEIGKVTVSTKPNGTGDAVENTETRNFIKIDGKWYVSMSNPFA